MAKRRDLVGEVSEIRLRNQIDDFGLKWIVLIASIRRHLTDVVKVHDRPEELMGSSAFDYIPIKIVAAVEVFASSWVRSFVNAGGERSRQITDFVASNRVLKLDADIAQALTSREVTVGELAAQHLSLRDAGGFMSLMAKLGGDEFRSRLSRSLGNPRKGHIGADGHNLEGVMSDIDRLFRARHVIAHELPDRSPYSIQELSSFLSAAERLLYCTNEILIEALTGHPPRTEAENAAAAKAELDQMKGELEQTVVRLRQKSEGLPTGLQLVEAVHKAWSALREAQTNLVTFEGLGSGAFLTAYGIERRSVEAELDWWSRHWLLKPTDEPD